MQKKQVNIIWFRNDLRIKDNPAMAEGLKSDIPVIGLYCFEPRLYDNYFYGVKKTESFRAQFIIEAVEDLKSNLETLNIGLKISLESPTEAFKSIVDEFEIKSVFYQKEWTSEEVKVENELKQTFTEIKFKSYFGQFLFHPEDIPFDDYSIIPQVFTNFRKQCQKNIQVRKCIEQPEPQIRENFVNFDDYTPSLSDLDLSEFKKDVRSAFPFQGGETAAWQRLNYYFWETEKLKYYKKTRNGLLGKDYSSKFSGWLAHGCISPKQIYWQVKQFEKQVKKNQDTYWLIFELIWRDYFKYVSLKYGNAIFKIGGILQKDYDWHRNKAAFKAWSEGKTKDDFVNANMIELKQTGFMSNRGRQNVASYWSKTLKQDWRIGAAYFEALLIDYDVHSNWGNWMYNSGVGNDPRDRKFNTQLQAKRYDSSGQYRRTWLQDKLF
ncbi:DASH family cryptochrome [Flavobacteriaceae bacterium 14752]|uniref:DASH family cryptochrome n=1 Tax=Mesohalobacter salilacus TaxID=2491711 RepID=UPI000F639090|nr:DASH family cryptochrome [Flavobacteriaceae bacterium 14752]